MSSISVGDCNKLQLIQPTRLGCNQKKNSIKQPEDCNSLKKVFFEKYLHLFKNSNTYKSRQSSNCAQWSSMIVKLKNRAPDSITDLKSGHANYSFCRDHIEIDWLKGGFQFQELYNNFIVLNNIFNGYAWWIKNQAND